MLAEKGKFVEGIGEIPTDWGVKSADEVSLKITKGTTPPKVDIVDHQEIPFLRVNNLGFNGSIDKKSNFIFVSKSAHKGFLARSIAYPGDILMNIVGPPLGKVSMLGDEFSEYNMNQAIVIYRLEDHVIHRDFFLAYLLSDTAQQWLQSRSKKTSGQQNLTIELCKGLPVPLPPLGEQKKIAQILSTWDKAITTTEQLLANSQQQKTALMQQLLTGKKRLLDKNGVKFSGEWRLAQLSNLFDRVTEKNNGQSTNVVTISGRHGLIRQEDFFKKSVASETLDGYFLLKHGQFAYNKSYSNGYPMGAIKRLNRYADGVVTTLYICFEITDAKKIDGDYWEHYFESGLMNKGLSQVAHEGGRAHGLLNVKPADFFSLKVAMPSFEEQQRIAAVLSESSRRIVITSQYLDALKREKKALMKKLLTGRLRVKAQ